MWGLLILLLLLLLLNEECLRICVRCQPHICQRLFHEGLWCTAAPPDVQNAAYAIKLCGRSELVWTYIKSWPSTNGYVLSKQFNVMLQKVLAEEWFFCDEMHFSAKEMKKKTFSGAVSVKVGTNMWPSNILLKKKKKNPDNLVSHEKECCTCVFQYPKPQKKIYKSLNKRF